MRIAISGTHCCGKTTLIDEFLLAHHNYAHEPEPYTALQDDYGESFAAEPSSEDFYRQLEFNLDRLRHYSADECVIFERGPVDFLAYMLALKDLRRDENASRVVDASLEMVTKGLQFLDLIVFLPAGDVARSAMSDSEDPELRSSVDRRLVEILTDDDFGLFSSGRPVVLEAAGSTSERLSTIETALQVGLTGREDR